MQTLLVVLVILCALALAVHMGRGFWARTRSVERHQQALDTLAGLTQGSEGPSSSSGAGPEHQAHVRLIGPSGETSAGEMLALPPPRAFPRMGHSSASPFRRPSRTSPSAASIDAVATATTASRLSGAQVVRSGLPRPPAGPAPTVSPEQRVPVFAPPAPTGEPTRPVPVIRPHVFYFDDLSAREKARAEEQRNSRGRYAKKTRWRRRAHAISTGTGASSDAVTAFTGPTVVTGPDAVTGPMNVLQTIASSEPAAAIGTAASTRTSTVRPFSGTGRKPLVPRPVVAAAVVVGVAAVAAGVALKDLPSHTTAAPRTHPTTVSHPHRPVTPTTTVAPAVTTTTTTTRTTTTTAAPPPKPAVLVSSGAGTATYHLTSRSASIVVKASGPCWIEVRAGSPQGQVIYEGTLTAGGESSIITGPAWIRLGDPPNVAVTVDGTHMSVPGASEAVPLNLQFTVG
jgi:hypothetical protein